MTLKREIKDAYIEGGASIYVKTHSNAVYVDDNETETLTKRLDNIKGKIDNNTSQLNEKVNINQSILDYNTDDIYLASFFDYSDKFNSYIYATKDGINFTQLSSKYVSTGFGDTGIIFYNGMFYQLADNNRPGDKCSFTIFTSKNLIDWNRKDIVLSDYTDENYRVYGADFFIDDNEDMYIIYSQQYGNMNGSDGSSHCNFRPKIVKINNLEEFTFDTPRLINIDDHNRIDPTIIKKDNTYYLFIKKEIDEGGLKDGTIGIWTSDDLVNWTKQTDAISSLSGYKFEAPCVCNINGIWYLYVDNWDGSLNGYMHYCTSTDLINWSEPIKIQTMSRLRHGSVFKIDDIKAKKIINNLFVQELMSNNINPLFYNNKFVNGVDVKPYCKNKYIELFSINMPMTWTAFNIKFKITDTQNIALNSEILLCARNKSDKTSLTDCLFKEINTYKQSIADSLVVISQSGVHRVFLKIENKVSITPTVSIIDFEAHQSITFDIKNSTPIDDLPVGNQINCVKETFADDLKRNIRLSKSYETLSNTSVQLKFCGMNGVAEIKGHTNGYSEKQIIDYNLMLLNGNIGIVNNNANGATITVTKDSYSSYIYTLTITTGVNYSVFDVTLPTGSYFIK